ncbi:class I adenylate-forming enzyme family protein [Aliamphritea spongicola]|uniref:class I adenylate-forming enzyme family protein n=1 Tax=Aliamphritea spongicola TaxID=707589 RepID=UPI00196B4BB8|nr:AMP-binding protein [Aliamphritea spongicola]MBN3560833.1 AMP-binding protein [Aliamphritea spongicola]
MNLGSLVSRSARFWGDRIALKDPRTTVTFRQLDERTDRLVNALSDLGVKQGERVAVFAWNRSEIAEVEVALLKGGFVRVPMNARLSAQEAVHVSNDSFAKVIIVDPEHEAAARQALSESEYVEHILVMGDDNSYEQALFNASADLKLPDMDPSDIAVHHYTSGSSGVLKAAVHSVGNRQTMLRKLIFRNKLTADNHEICVHVGPITHVSGMSLLPLMSLGHTSIILPRFDADNFLQTVQDEKATQTYLVPTMINRIVTAENRHNYDISTLKMIRYGAAPISPARLREAIEFFGPIMNQAYGGGEMCSSVTMLTETDHARAVGDKPALLQSCGRPLFDTEVKVVDEQGNELPVGEHGELVVRGQDIMQGYWNAPDLTEAVLIDGYYHTGDIAYADDEGYLFIVDRKKEMIVSGGFNIYPNEVENALYHHPAVFEACVVGVPDADMGEAIKAVVVLKDNQQATQEELVEQCGKELGKFKRPHSVDFVAELPKNNSGKIQRKAVRDPYWAGQDRQV